MTGRWAACRTHTLAAALFLASAGHALPTVHYVDVNCTNTTPPYTNWPTAATNIQDAVDAAVAGDEIVVTDGTYATGGRDGNRVEVDKTLSLRSVNGPQFTTISGGGTNRCVYLTNNASLSGFTLTNGWSFSGGGVYCESAAGVVSNCVISGNYADYSEGGGASGGTLHNCTLTGNSADYGGGGAFECTLNNCALTGNYAWEGAVFGGGGGGAYSCTLNNCTLMGNSAGPLVLDGIGGGALECTLNNCALSGNSASYYGGGAYSCTLNNCTLTGNSATTGGGGGAAYCTLNNCTLTDNSQQGAYNCALKNCIAFFNGAVNCDPSCTLNYCCTMPQPTNGVGNITNAPLFVNTNGWANLRLQSDSPCINAGTNAYAPAGPDLDGNPRILGVTVDIGAYEYQSLSLLNFSVVSNHAGFNITGQSNQVVVVQTSADLLNWWPLATNTLNGHPFPFSDPTPTTLPRCFYRARAQ